MKKIILFAAAIVLVGAIVFWQYFLKGYLLLPSADRFVGSFYEQYNQGDFRYLYNVLSDQKIRNRINPPQFQSMMQDSYRRLGPVTARKRSSWKAKSDKENQYLLVEYKITRTKVGSREKFVLIRKKKDWFVFDYLIRAA